MASDARSKILRLPSTSVPLPTLLKYNSFGILQLLSPILPAIALLPIRLYILLSTAPHLLTRPLALYHTLYLRPTTTLLAHLTALTLTTPLFLLRIILATITYLATSPAPLPSAPTFLLSLQQPPSTASLTTASSPAPPRVRWPRSAAR
ncbi:hypothetical protein B0J12DRAFT_696395 [Macrophomina phaseolina]|uniref:Uncharacterized protein n=1 Tax=Macrophomina phaseolina TaxID=35725 RepID=A0ABQ8GJX2_9PEZI|nr:hypothetical protein B0J12DRAFT_696395 [Macrophomina phaseolina]